MEQSAREGRTSSQVTQAFISLGSNLGDLEEHLRRARADLGHLPGAWIGACSPIYFTEPQDVRNQPWFANQVVRLDCEPAWTARNLLRTLLRTEDRMGRVRDLDKGPRLIDLDLLLFGSQHHAAPSLTLPHPRIHARAFVLVPLHDIAPELVFPDGQKLSDALARLRFHVQGQRIYQEAPVTVTRDGS